MYTHQADQWSVYGARAIPETLLGALVDVARHDEPSAALGLVRADGPAAQPRPRHDDARLGHEADSPSRDLRRAVSLAPVVGIARIAKAAYFDLRTEPLAKIRKRFGKAIAAGDDFWEWCKDASYATLLEVAEVRRLAPIACPKRDRRGWVVLPPP